MSYSDERRAVRYPDSGKVERQAHGDTRRITAGSVVLLVFALILVVGLNYVLQWDSIGDVLIGIGAWVLFLVFLPTVIRPRKWIREEDYHHIQAWDAVIVGALLVGILLWLAGDL